MDGYHITCGGQTSEASGDMRECYSLQVTGDDELVVAKARPLPAGLADGCSGSDGTRLVVAGGVSGTAE